MANSVDIRTALNIVSDVLINRPSPLREFDQIYMKAGDVLLHCDHICGWLKDRDVVFIGDGDAIALSLMHLGTKGQIGACPRTVTVLDFDDRMVGSVNRFAKAHGLTDRIFSANYNVRDALPADIVGRFSAFHTNPPFGKSNGGKSVDVFIRRGIEACGKDCRACVVLADDDTLPWTQDVLGNVQSNVVASGFMISELRPKYHQYHLDDAPDLTSATMLIKRHKQAGAVSMSRRITDEECENFYGQGQPLQVKRVKDRTAAGRYPSRDHEIEFFEDKT